MKPPIKDTIQEKLYIKDKFFCPKLQLFYTFIQCIFNLREEDTSLYIVRTKIAGPKVFFIIIEVPLYIILMVYSWMSVRDISLLPCIIIKNINVVTLTNFIVIN